MYVDINRLSLCVLCVDSVWELLYVDCANSAIFGADSVVGWHRFIRKP